MFSRQMIDKVLITLETGSKTNLFILLARDGSIHRKGNGSPDVDLPLRTGISPLGHFEALMMTVNDSIFEHTGIIKLPNPQGEVCQLTLIFQGPGQLDFSFRVIYGRESQGPPVELAQVLINAVKLTEDWYRQQLEAAEKPAPKWWQFWK